MTRATATAAAAAAATTAGNNRGPLESIPEDNPLSASSLTTTAIYDSRHEHVWFVVSTTDPAPSSTCWLYDASSDGTTTTTTPPPTMTTRFFMWCMPMVIRPAMEHWIQAQPTQQPQQQPQQQQQPLPQRFSLSAKTLLLLAFLHIALSYFITWWVCDTFYFKIKHDNDDNGNDKDDDDNDDLLFGYAPAWVLLCNAYCLLSFRFSINAAAGATAAAAAAAATRAGTLETLFLEITISGMNAMAVPFLYASCIQAVVLWEPPLFLFIQAILQWTHFVTITMPNYYYCDTKVPVVRTTEETQINNTSTTTKNHKQEQPSFLGGNHVSMLLDMSLAVWIMYHAVTRTNTLLLYQMDFWEYLDFWLFSIEDSPSSPPTLHFWKQEQVVESTSTSTSSRRCSSSMAQRLLLWFTTWIGNTTTASSTAPVVVVVVVVTVGEVFALGGVAIFLGATPSLVALGRLLIRQTARQAMTTLCKLVPLSILTLFCLVPWGVMIGSTGEGEEGEAVLRWRRLLWTNTRGMQWLLAWLALSWTWKMTWFGKARQAMALVQADWCVALVCLSWICREGGTWTDSGQSLVVTLCTIFELIYLWTWTWTNWSAAIRFWQPPPRDPPKRKRS